MTATTKLEKEIVLRLFKDFTVDFNPSSISKEIGKTRVGASKALNSLEEDTIVLGKDFGKARFYRINLKDEYAVKNVETLLLEEAKAFSRWKDELKKIFSYVDVAVIFGSIVRKPKNANDIDILLIFSEKNDKNIMDVIKEKNKILAKKIHTLKQTPKDFKQNIKKRDKVLINAIKEGVVLYGYEKYVEMIRDAL